MLLFSLFVNLIIFSLPRIQCFNKTFTIYVLYMSFYPALMLYNLLFLLFVMVILNVIVIIDSLSRCHLKTYFVRLLNMSKSKIIYSIIIFMALLFPKHLFFFLFAAVTFSLSILTLLSIIDVWRVIFTDE